MNSLGIKLNLPEEIIFIRTTSKEEGGAGGYTRANYIVLGPQYSMMPDSMQLRIVAGNNPQVPPPSNERIFTGLFI